uniref:hypothetical protein n=1 Tax=Salmonella sp. TaxID=599 RepID=UPI001CDA07C4|nr:hypothetical protein [Salmonella sp.]
MFASLAATRRSSAGGATLEEQGVIESSCLPVPTVPHINVGFTPSRRELKNNDLRKVKRLHPANLSLCHLRIGGDGF